MPRKKKENPKKLVLSSPLSSQHGEPSNVNKRPKRKSRIKESDSELETLLLDSITRSAVENVNKLNTEKYYKLGEVELYIHDHVIEQGKKLRDQKFWLYVSEIPERSMIYFEWDEEGESNIFIRTEYYTLKNELNPKTFCEHSACGIKYAMSDYLSHSRKLILCVYLAKSSVMENHQKEMCLLDNKCVVHVMNFIREIPMIERFNDIEQHTADDPEEIFSIIKGYHIEETKSYSTDIQHDKLNVDLRPYQKAAVTWMLKREKRDCEENKTMHILFKEIWVNDCKEVLYYNFVQGYFVKIKPNCMPSTPGGILADEMGLGKTVEVLACMLSNPCETLAKYEGDNGKVETCESSREIDLLNGSDNNSEVLDADMSETSRDYEEKIKVGKHIDRQIIDEGSKSPKKSKYSNKVVDLQETGPSTSNDDNANSGNRKSTRKRVSFNTSISIDDYALDTESEDDVTWTAGLRFGEHVKKKKVNESRKPKKTPFRRKKKSKQAVKKTDTVSECIEEVIRKYCGSSSKTCKKSTINQKTKSRNVKAIDKATLFSRYEEVLQMYSGLHSLKQDTVRKRKYSGFFDTKVSNKSMFECICGSVGDFKQVVKCSKCGVWQHSDCVKFDTTSNKAYFCPHCWQTQPKYPSPTTLIVAPSSISQQWMDEIHKLVQKNFIKATFYEGVFRNGFVQPRTLADHDIVITTYEVLCKELDYVDLPHCNSSEGRRFRNAKRYMALPSPLPCVQWWRVCLDEAQMVECTTTRTAEMALRLSAVHRWCITGTPIQKSISDIYGLIMFLGVDPYDKLLLWKRLLEIPYKAGIKEYLFDVLCPIMWRTCKVDVENQIGIPEQKEEIHWVNFSPVEEHFYRQQHVNIARTVLERIYQLPEENMNIKLRKINKQTLSGIMNPLITLRQACCHPQAVKGKFASLSKTTLTMDELLESLIKKTANECEESFRRVISSLNGIAGIFIIQEDWSNAVLRYRQVLELIEENKEDLKADRLQRIHTLHNLDELLKIHAENDAIPKFERDKTLNQEASELEKSYLDKCYSLINSSKQTVTPLTDTVEKCQSQLSISDTTWWSLTLDWCLSEHDEVDILERIKQALSGGKKKTFKQSIYGKVIGVKGMLLENCENLEDRRYLILNAMNKLETEDHQILVNEAVDCHLRTNVTGGRSVSKLCNLCKTSNMFENYEKLLFREEHSTKGHQLVDDVRVFGVLNRIVWSGGETEIILRTLLAYAKTKKLKENWISDGNTQLKIFEAMKKEFKHLRIYWRHINDNISALDELNMCKLRLRLRYDNEPNICPKKQKLPGNKSLENLKSDIRNPVEHIFILERHEVEPHLLRMVMEKNVAQGELKRRMGQLKYLKNLKRDGLGGKDGANTECCPVCRKDLSTKWSVLLCGHCYCIECLNAMRKHQLNKKLINCAVCRENTASGEISYVNTQSFLPDAISPIPSTSKDIDVDASNNEIVGNDSAKVEAVVRVLKKIISEDPTAKTLVFSSWSAMLIVLSRALQKNNISLAHMESGKKLQSALDLFKNPAKHISALLLPVNLGANGLNLIEATHVILVEPILNPAKELQALGRIHRIGQTKETFVHRLIVRGTIEERMYQVLKTNHKTRTFEENPVTLRDLHDMFTSS